MEFCDLMERGVLDPAKVTINAIENSASGPLAGALRNPSTWLIIFSMVASLEAARIRSPTVVMRVW